MTHAAVAETVPGVHHARAAHVSRSTIVDGDDVTRIDIGYPGDRDCVIASLNRIGRAPAGVVAIVLTHAHPDQVGLDGAVVVPGHGPAYRGTPDDAATQALAAG